MTASQPQGRVFADSGLEAFSASLRAAMVRGPVSLALFEAILFAVKQVWAALFGIAMLALLLVSFLFWPDDAALARYDAITIGAVLLQLAMISFRLESWAEVRVICVFHAVGTLMEIFKVHGGSWIYPESAEAMLVVFGVPLFSGFMYASVGSYIARVWRLFDFRFDRFAPLWLQALLAVAAYVNFFSHHYTVDLRYALFAISALIYGPCVIWLRPDRRRRPLPLLLGLIFVAFLVWCAENLGTYARAWTYPAQDLAWSPVPLTKMGSWYLLMLIGFVLAATVRERDAPRA